MAKQPVFLYEKKLNGRVVVMTMNRPEVLNSLNNELSAAIRDGWARFRDDDEAWVAILTGAGDKAFCAGRDLKEEAQERIELKGRHKPKPAHRRRLGPLAEAFDLWKPTIAAINGYAIAGGWIMAQDCDIRIAAEHAELGIAEVMWNLPVSGVACLTRQMHLQHALEVALWGDRRITAQRAYEMGWVSRVVPKERLMDEAMDWAERMLYLAPQAVRNIKQILYRGFYMPALEGEAFGRALDQNLEGMEDSIEGPRAFAEKRKPQFKNK